MNNKLLCTEGDWKIFEGMSRIEGEWDIYGNNDILATVTTIEDANLISASKDLYNALYDIIKPSSFDHVIPSPLFTKAIEALQKANHNYKK
jgi:hypothetical protein